MIKPESDSPPAWASYKSFQKIALLVGDEFDSIHEHDGSSVGAHE